MCLKVKRFSKKISPCQSLKTRSTARYHRRALYGEKIHCLARDQSTFLTAVSFQSFGLLQSSSSSKNGVDAFWSDSSRLGNLATSRKGWWRSLDSWVVSGTTFVFALFCMCCRLIKAGQTTLSSSLCSLVYDLQSDLTLSLFLLTICASIMITTLGTYSFMCSLGPLGSTLATLFWCPAAEPNYVNRQTRTNSLSLSLCQLASSSPKTVLENASGVHPLHRRLYCHRTNGRTAVG